MASKQYYAYDDAANRWRHQVYSPYGARVALKGAKAHEVRHAPSGTPVTFTYGAHPKNSPARHNPEENNVPTSTSKSESKLGYGPKGTVRPNLRYEDIYIHDDKAVLAAADKLIEAYNARFRLQPPLKAVRVTVEGVGGNFYPKDKPHQLVVEPNTEPTIEEKRLATHRDIMSRFNRLGFGAASARHAFSSAVLGRNVESNRIDALDDADRERILEALKKLEA